MLIMLDTGSRIVLVYTTYNVNSVTETNNVPVSKHRVLERWAYHNRVPLDLSLSLSGTDHNVHVSSTWPFCSETKPEKQKKTVCTFSD